MNSHPNSAKALVVMGMHRSGTSALAGLLNHLGVEMGSFLMPAQERVNEKGFWEQEKVVSVHDRLLQYYGFSWDDPRPLPQDWWLQDFSQQCLEEISGIIAEDMKASTLWAIKDPRMCRLLPLWRLIFNRLNIEPMFLCIVRNPLEVAASLYSRDSMPKDLAILLWLQHNLEAVDGTSGYRRRFIGYGQLLNQREKLVRGILRDFSIDLDSSTAVINKDGQFLSVKLRHHRISDAELDSDPSVSGIVGMVYRKLISAAEAGTDLSNNDWQQIRQQYMDSEQLFNPWLNLSQKIQKDIANKNVAYENLRHENELITRGLREAGEIINSNRGELERVDAALKEAQQIVRVREAREVELDAALKEAQQLVAQGNARIRELEQALEMATAYVRDREKDISSLNTQVKELQVSMEQINKHWLLGSMTKFFIRSDEPSL